LKIPYHAIEKMRVTKCGMRKDSPDLSKRDPLASNLYNRERALRCSITRIPCLFTQPSFQNRGTRYTYEKDTGNEMRDEKKFSRFE